MPLVRYEVRCEHSLANPELYRTVGRDDSEALLEGVAMAGLVGIVRQLGDLAEFAAEIFRDLHDDVMTVLSRSQNLKSRVTRLEADLPAVEKGLLAEASQFRFAYTARSQWRASLPVDQNLCSKGDFPRFVRNFYEDCRGPPRLFLLDKFDAAGQGACVKRYTDPTFFRLVWATSQLEKAEQVQRERKAQQKKKSSAMNRSSNNSKPQPYPRERLSSAHFENLEGFTGDFTPELRSKRLDRVPELATEGDLTPEGARSPERNFLTRQLPQVARGPVLTPLKISAKDIENAHLGRRTLRPINGDELSSDEEEASDADHFVDALTTMGSDVESETDARSRWEVEAHHRRVKETDRATSLNHSVLKAHVEGHRQTPPRAAVDLTYEEDFSRRALQEPEGRVPSLHNSVLKVNDEDHRQALPGAAADMTHTDEFSRRGYKGSEGMAGAATVHELEEYFKDPTSQPSMENGGFHLTDETITDKSTATEHTQNCHANIEGTVLEDLPPLSELPDMPISSRDNASFHNDSTESERVVEGQHIPVDTLQDQQYKLEDSVWQSRQEDVLPSAYTEDDDSCQGRYGLEAGGHDSEVQTSNILNLANTDRTGLPLKLNGGLDLSNKLNARFLKYNEHHNGESTSSHAMILHEGNGHEEEGEFLRAPGQAYELTYGSSSNTSSPYTNLSSSSVLEDDGYTSSASSSPKSTTFCALLSPPESPPRMVGGLMSLSPLYNTNFLSARGSPNSPPIIPFLSASPTISRSPSGEHEPPAGSVQELPQNSSDKASPRLQSPPQLMSPPQRDGTVRSSLSPQSSDLFVTKAAHNLEMLKNLPMNHPERATDYQSLQLEPYRSQSLTMRNPGGPRQRTWNDRSESNVAATLFAIRQAAAAASDDETRSECRSDGS